MIEAVVLTGIIIAVLVGAVYDIKKGLIPNKLNFSLISVGIAINIILSIKYGNIKFIEFSLLNGIITFIFAYILWKLGFWGGGDVKLITAIAIFLPFNPMSLEYNLLNIHIPVIAIYPFILTIFLNSVILSLPFLLFYLTAIYLKNNKVHLSLFIKNIRMIFNKKSLIKTILIFKENILKLKTLKIIILSISISILLTYTKNGINGGISIFNLSFKWFLLLLILFIFSKLFIWLFKHFKRFILNKTKLTIPITNIKEGMIIQNLEVPKKIEKELKTVLKSLKIDHTDKEQQTNEIKNDSQLIANSKYASGIFEDEAEFLKELENKGLIKNRVDIKITVPYGPSLFAGLITGIIFGDICSLLIDIIKNIILKSMF
ncbi:MAG: A24 family peptidase [Methanobrevibacter sp.]|jgi:preflagellin peptidase FlaK|nr:A24 family peptidase [Candidatus Methanovirga australis]